MHLGALAVALVFLAVLPAEVQSAGPVPKVAWLGLPNERPETSQLHHAFIQGLRDLGYLPGRNIIVEARRYTTGDQLRQALDEFVGLKVDVIVVGPPVAAAAAKQATHHIPVVCSSCGDPVDTGLVASLARPGGNLTGLASLSAELIGKRVELLKELLPRISRIAVFVYPANPGTPATLRALDTTGRALGIETQRIEIRSARDFENAFRSAATGGAGAVFIQDDPLSNAARNQIAALALKHRLPTSAGIPQIVDAGGLLAYGPDRLDLYRRAAEFVDKIL